MASLAKLAAYMELVRIHNVLIASLTTLIGYYACMKATLGSLKPIDIPLLLACTVVGLVAAGGYAVNDYYDVDIDRVNKPWRPIPSGRIAPRSAHTLSIVLMVAGCLLSTLLGLAPLLYAVAASILLYLYAYKLKRAGLPGNFVVAFNSGSAILYGSIAYASLRHAWNHIMAGLLPFTYAFLLVLGREFVKGIEDYEGDRLGGARTLAVLLGPRRALYISLAVLLLVVFLSPLPWLYGYYSLSYLVLALVVDALILASIVVMLASKDLTRSAAKARSILKASFLAGALAFLIGLL